MNRKQFIQSKGATCKNWSWSWSFVNHDKKIVIFGAWDVNLVGKDELILDSKWESSNSGRKLPGYKQAIEHLDLVMNHGYSLMTFRVIFSDENQDDNGIGPAKIKDFVPELHQKKIHERDNKWFAVDELNPEMVARICWNSNGWVFPSGKNGKSKNANTYERHYGYGHEEWLLDTTKIIDGYHYGYIQAIGGNRDKYLGKIIDLYLYSINNTTKQRYWIGKIKNLQIVGSDESKNVKKKYQANGWINEMLNQLKAVDANIDAFNKYSMNEDFFAVLKYKLKDLELLDTPLEFSKDDDAIKADYYNLKKFIKLPAINNNSDFKFTPGHKERKKRSNTIITEQYGEKDLIHNQIQTNLYNSLVKKYGKKNVSTENPTGKGTFIDLVTSEDGKLTLYEIKTSKTINQCIRESIGQLLEYAHLGKQIPFIRLVIVSPFPTNIDVEKYFELLRDRYQIPIQYKQFDFDTNQLI